MRDAIDDVRDVERLAAKAAARRSTPRELRALGDSLAALPAVESALRRVAAAGRLAEMSSGWDDAPELAGRLCSALVERPPIAIGDDADDRAGSRRRARYACASFATAGEDAIARIQADERARTGIPSLKVGFNKVFGYYIEVTKSNLHLVPADYQRRQTITSGERFVTPALKEYEERVLTRGGAHRDARARTVRGACAPTAGAEIARLQRDRARGRRARRVERRSPTSRRAKDTCARRSTDDFELEIAAGRHPVVERMMPRDKFIPNDLRLVERCAR